MEEAVRRFFSAYPDADALEAVVDSSAHGPCLNLWAWRVHQGRHLDDAVRQAAGAQNRGFFYDIVDQLGSSNFQIRLAGIYPEWPDSIERGDEALITFLHATAAALPKKAPLFFHHVDAWPAVRIRGKDGTQPAT